MDISNKPTDSKRYVLFTSNHLRHCLTNIPFCIARRICTIVENENVKETGFKVLKKTLLEQKHPKSLTEVSILRAKEILLEVLRQTKTTKNEQNIPFTITYNPNNPNVFSMIQESFDNFQYSKTMSNILQRRKSMNQAPNVGRLLRRFKFESQHTNHQVKNWKEFRQLPLSFKSVHTSI